MHSEIKRLIYIPLLSRTCFEVVFQDPLQTAENPHNSITGGQPCASAADPVLSEGLLPHYLVRSGAPRTKLKHVGPPQGKTEELICSKEMTSGAGEAPVVRTGLPVSVASRKSSRRHRI